MKKIIFVALVSIFGFGSFAQTSKQDARDLKEALNGGFLQKYALSEHAVNYSIEAQGKKINGNFEKYSYKMGTDLVITNYALYEYFIGKNDFIIISVVKDGIAKVFVDLNADGILDEYISNGNKFPGSLFQEEYAMYLSFSVHG